ncbi:MAG: FecR domain-containing protein [Planctomycetes bacterium]|nr:FecR domain-containing protein [Planctomycetota bacterium]
MVQIDGTVELLRAGSPFPVAEGAVIQRDDVIRCAAKSAAVLKWSNGSILRLYPESEITLSGVVYDANKKIEKSVIQLAKGRIFAKGQVPEHIFCEFRIQMGKIFALTQGAEFALTYLADKEAFQAFVLLGRLVTQIGTQRIRIEEGNQGTIRAGQAPDPSDIAPASDSTKSALTKVSSELGGSLLVEETGGDVGGPLRVKIGGVRNRRGNAPYAVNFKAIVHGGSGKVKSIRWDFGDGESLEGKTSEHTFTQGVYVVILRIVDENGEETSAQISISAEEDCAC